jgi:Stage II sporulation protein E (SpoIIE)
MARGAVAKAKMLIGGVCVLAAGYASGEAIAPPDSAATAPLSVPSISAPAITPPSTSVATLPTISIPAPPTPGVPALPTTGVPTLPTTSVTTLPTTTLPTPNGPPTSTGQTPTGVWSQAGASQASLAGTRQERPAAGTRRNPATERKATALPHRSPPTPRPAVKPDPRRFLASGRPGGSAVPPLRGSSSRRPANSHSSGNPLDTIGGYIPLPIPVPDWSKPIIVVLLVLVILFGARARLTATRAKRLERQRGSLREDVSAMQRALVPAAPARLEGLAVSVAYRSAEGPAAGGDFYDVFAPEPGTVAIILGDVSGHGREALSHAVLTHYTLRAYLQAGMEPRAALGLAGQVLAEPDFGHYATVVLAVYDAQSRRLTYASAGHPPPIFRGAQAREPLIVCSSPPVGLGLPTGRRQTSISFDAGAEACFFTDGLIEARSQETLLGRERLIEILGELGPRSSAADVLEQVRAEADATRDDMAACILVQETEGSGVFTDVEELETDLRELSGSGVKRFLDACRVPAADAARALRLAHEIAGEFGTALLRVELGRNEATVRATRPDPDTPRATGSHLRRALPGAQAVSAAFKAAR